MFVEITRENIEILENSFIEKNQLISELDNNPFAKILIYKEEKILGYIYYSDIYDRAEINQFEVFLSTRNCGIGTKILKEMMNKVNKNITLEVNCTNEPAIHLYEKVGFKKIAIRKNYYNGIDGILMERNTK